MHGMPQLSQHSICQKNLSPAGLKRFQMYWKILSFSFSQMQKLAHDIITKHSKTTSKKEALLLIIKLMVLKELGKVI